MKKLEAFTKSYLKVFLSFVILGFICYSTVVSGDFVFDDDTFILNNDYIKDTKYIPKLYTSSLTEGAHVPGGNFYRPNQALLHNLVYQLAGKKPAPFHILSILFHILNSFLLFLFVRKLNFSSTAAFIAGLIFLIHPIQTEAVAYISGLGDPLVFCFILCGLLSYIEARRVEKSRDQWLWLISSLVCFILGLLSKESAITFIALILITELFLSAGQKKFKLANSTLVFLTLILVLSISYIYIKSNQLSFNGKFGLTTEENDYTSSLWVRLISFATIFVNYLGLIIFPVNQYIERPYEIGKTIFTEPVLLTFFGFMFFGLMAYLAYHSFKKDRIVFFCIAWFFILIAPVSGIIPINAIYLEHWLYMPIAGVLIFVAALFDRMKPKYKSTFLIVIAFVSASYSSKTILRNIEWADAEAFYKNEIRHNKNSARIYNNLAMVYSDKKKYAKAIDNYVKAIKINDSYPQTHHNLGIAYMNEGFTQDAINQFAIALHMYPGFIYSLGKLAEVYSQTNPEKSKMFNELYQREANGETVKWEEIEIVLKK